MADDFRTVCDRIEIPLQTITVLKYSKEIKKADQQINILSFKKDDNCVERV
jgi:hypothetical protein